MQTKRSLMFIMMMMAANPVPAHFGAVVPSDDIVAQDDNKTLCIPGI